MPQADAEPTPARPSRCANHPGVASAAVCARCRRPLCLPCAVPVRGSVFGPECISAVLEQAPASVVLPARRVPVADVLRIAGFGLVTALSGFPWSRFGDASGPLGAWRVHWSLLAVAAGAAGLIASVLFRRRPPDPRVEVAVLLPLTVLVVAGAVLHRVHPPSLSGASVVPVLAAAAGGAALLGVGLEAWAWLRAR